MDRPCRIRVLPDLVVRRIAAGEVVERPASVVKELLENALDAGASRITVAVEEGGKRLIRVTDDGCGMSPDELRLAVTRHATSKLQSEDDLFSIRTLGFRGEALASISAVSRLRIVSRLPEADAGHEIRVTAEQVELSRAAGCPPGTTVEVRDLFFNVPARRRFLRAVSTEAGQIQEQVIRAALPCPDVDFTLTHNDRVRLRLPAGGSLHDRIARLYGAELSKALLSTKREERGVRLEAYLAPPAQSRAGAQWQYVFVNGRYVRDRQIQHAIREAYRGLMEPNRYAVVFLFLTLDPAMVDVNVHPTKIEVRWADGRLIYSQVLSALRDALREADLVPALRTRSSEPIDDARRDALRRRLADELKATPPIVPHAGAPSGPVPADQSDRSLAPPARPGGDALESWRLLYGREDGSGPSLPGVVQRSENDRTAENILEGLAGEPPARPRAIQMHNLYLVAETEDGILIVDQHALHERVLYEQLRERITAGPLECQRLLLPEPVNVPPQQIALLERHAELLRRVGIEAAPFGDNAVAVHGVPSLIRSGDVASFMADLLDRLAQWEDAAAPDRVLDEVLSMMACRAAVKAGDPLAPEEIEALFARRHLIDKATSCPHGRPTMLRLTKADLERGFHRT